MPRTNNKGLVYELVSWQNDIQYGICKHEISWINFPRLYWLSSDPISRGVSGPSVIAGATTKFQPEHFDDFTHNAYYLAADIYALSHFSNLRNSCLYALMTKIIFQIYYTLQESNFHWNWLFCSWQYTKKSISANYLIPWNWLFLASWTLN